MGFIAWDRILTGDLSLSSWNEGTEHPMVAKYIYGFFMRPEAIYLDGAKGLAKLSNEEIRTINDGNYIQTILFDSMYAVPYDFTLPRIASAIFNALSIMLTFIFARKILSVRWSLLAASILLLTPRFVFLGQLMTYESITVFLFGVILYFFYNFLQKPKDTKLILILGLLCGLFFWTRYNNIVIFPFLIGWLFIDYHFHKNKQIFTWKLIMIPIIAFLFGFATWPLLWQEFPKYLIQSMFFHQQRLVGISFYYTEHLLVTTSLVTLFGFFLGLFWCLKERTYWSIFALWWLICIIGTYTLFCITLGGPRYIAVLYPLIAILAAYGYSKLLKKKWELLLIPLILFLFFEQMKMFPYYMNYYNQLVGGTKGAIQKNYDFSYWGEGQREAGLWINKNAPRGSSVGLIVTPRYVFPRLRQDMLIKGFVDDKTDADYVVISRRHLTELPKNFWDNYKIIYEEKTDKQTLIYVAGKISNFK